MHLDLYRKYSLKVLSEKYHRPLLECDVGMYTNYIYICI